MKKLKLGMIWAEAEGGVIGRQGVMPWHLPEDLNHFKETTSGSPVIMGRRTWDSLPEQFRPLPGRQNIVVTRNKDFIAQGAEVVTSLPSALKKIKHSHFKEVDAWVMGGGQLYLEAMPFATKLVVTKIQMRVADADTFAPEITAAWRLRTGAKKIVTKSGITLVFEEYDRLNT